MKNGQYLVYSCVMIYVERHLVYNFHCEKNKGRVITDLLNLDGQCPKSLLSITALWF